MRRSDIVPKARDLVYKAYGDDQMNYWEALYYISPENLNKIHTLAVKHNTSHYSMYLDIINGVRDLDE